MKLLIICHDLPSPDNATSLRVLESLKYLSEKYNHDIMLLAFKRGEEYPDLSNYCQVETVDITMKNKIWTIVNILSPKNIFSTTPNLLSYSPKMRRKVAELLIKHEFDVIAIDHFSMLYYTLELGIPQVLLEIMPASKIYKTHFHFERNLLIKMLHLLRYYMAKKFEKKWNRLNIAIAVSESQKESVLAYMPDINIVVIPHGIDTDYFKAVDIEQNFPTLMINGGMNRLLNVMDVLWFYNEVYPLIKEKILDVKLYIVGKSPTKEILQLSADESVLVTGYVKDLRPYFSRAWVVVAPLTNNFGVKVRVLQAMAMGKPVVSTSMVTFGIDVSAGENIILADDPREFAERVIELLNNEELRKRIGANARKLMEEEYSWERLTDELNKVLEKAKTNYHKQHR
jgi:glycosyltransferase involved in cell wall biosynthesis